MLDIPKLDSKLTKYLKSKKGKRETAEYFRKLKIEQEINNKRCDRVGKYLEGKDFDKILLRLKKEHDETYRDKCYKKGYEPYPNNKFTLLMDYIRKEYAPVENDKIPQDFLSGCYFFRGYYFTIYCGQGCFYRVYDSKLNHYLQI